jgi:hypothetical protein
MSKTFNMAGWRIGYCAGNSKIVDALARVKGYYDYGIFQAIQVASIIGLRDCGDLSREQAQRYEQRRDVLLGGLERIGWTGIESPRAGYVPLGADAPSRSRAWAPMEFARRLMEDAEVALARASGLGRRAKAGCASHSSKTRSACSRPSARSAEHFRSGRKASNSSPARDPSLLEFVRRLCELWRRGLWIDRSRITTSVFSTRATAQTGRDEFPAAVAFRQLLVDVLHGEADRLARIADAGRQVSDDLSRPWTR